MTGFAAAQGALGPHSWSWDLRSVNAKGLDLRLRVPDWLEGLETALKTDLKKALARGNVSLTLRISRSEEGESGLQVNRAALASVLDALAVAEEEADTRGVSLRKTSGAELLSVRGVLEQSIGEDDPKPLVAALIKESATLVAEFVQMRDAEGAALDEVLRGQLDEVARLTAEAARLAEARKPQVAETLRANLATVLETSEGADADRVAQELALLAVKADVTEEIDRLHAHVAAARELLNKGGAVGRRLDFLMQEFNREANTLCSKAQNSDLTSAGLELKAIIDQMREQVQNIE
jgi:uncharacterized protein (TIGR00255 family)